MAEIASYAGYDFIVVDMEHGAGGVREALNCIRAVEAAGSSTVLRVPDNCQAWTKKALDLGPDGIMFPMIETGKAASDAVSYCRYRPEGLRGCAYTIVRDSKFGFDEEYLRNYTDQLLIMCQVLLFYLYISSYIFDIYIVDLFCLLIYTSVSYISS